MSQVTLEQVRATYKRRDAWWTVLLVDPLAARLVRLVAGSRWVTPTRLTGTAFLFGLLAAAAFTQATAGWLVLGAFLYYTSFVIDCVDGKIARLHGTGSVFGSWLDFLLDRLRVVICIVALFGGLFQETGDARFLYTAIAVTFLALFGYLNGAETDKARARRASRATPASPAASSAASSHTSLNGSLPGPVSQLRTVLHRHRIRLNLVSGVEFEMALFVVAPLVAAATGAGAVLAVSVVAGVLLIGFELALIGRFWLTARSFDRTMDGAPVPAPRADRSTVAERAHHPAT
ncbi:MAG: CDP-alcohol phosphatidyltransferase family protein [Natronosporangium sp.]